VPLSTKVFSLSFVSQSAEKGVCDMPYSNFSEKLQNIFEVGSKDYGVIVEKYFSKEKYFEIKIRRHGYFKLASVQI